MLGSGRIKDGPSKQRGASSLSLPLEGGGKVGVIESMVHPPLCPLPSREGRRSNGGAEAFLNRIEHGKIAQPPELQGRSEEWQQNL
jgi:hypothetical protein